MTTTNLEPVETVEPSVARTCGSVESPGDTQSAKIDRPGCYVCNRTGQLVRVTPDDIVSNSIEGLPKSEESVFVTRISGDPYLPVSRVRVQAANLNVEVAF